MRVVRRNWNLIGKIRTQPLNGAHGCNVVGVASNRDRARNGLDKRRNRTTSLKRVAVPTKLLANLKSDVTGTNSNVLGVADSKIDVTNIRTIRS
jgi:hypothetical protein